VPCVVPNLMTFFCGRLKKDIFRRMLVTIKKKCSVCYVPHKTWNNMSVSKWSLKYHLWAISSNFWKNILVIYFLKVISGQMSCSVLNTLYNYMMMILETRENTDSLSIFSPLWYFCFSLLNPIIIWALSLLWPFCTVLEASVLICLGFWMSSAHELY